MKKKIIGYIIIIVFFFVIQTVSITAKEYTCYYSYTKDDKNSTVEEIDVNIDTESKKIYSEGFKNLGRSGYTLDSMIDKTWTVQKIIDEYLKGGCESGIMVCEVNKKHQNTGGGGTKEYWVLMNLGLSGALPEDKKFFWIGKYYYTYQGIDSCFEATLDTEKSEGETVFSDYPCDVYEDNMDALKALACSNIDDLNTCSIKNVEDIDGYKKIKESIESYCNIALEHLNYTNPCLRTCLSISKDIQNIEGVSSNGNVCGFSQKLVLFVANIVKWVKYIVPIFVIMLGILDFIKAIAGEKEDEMKKAQDRLIKRLIASALIFIIPFIIEFILNKMGFAANGCGIIDL